MPPSGADMRVHGRRTQQSKADPGSERRQASDPDTRRAGDPTASSHLGMATDRGRQQYGTHWPREASTPNQPEYAGTDGPTGPPTRAPIMTPTRQSMSSPQGRESIECPRAQVDSSEVWGCEPPSRAASTKMPTDATGTIPGPICQTTSAEQRAGKRTWQPDPDQLRPRGNSPPTQGEHARPRN